jgi:hypothetical protein
MLESRLHLDHLAVSNTYDTITALAFKDSTLPAAMSDIQMHLQQYPESISISSSHIFKDTLALHMKITSVV